MSLNELALMTGVLAGFAVLRFGVPLTITWLVGRAAAHLTHAS